jgi:hypothetical protein
MPTILQLLWAIEVGHQDLAIACTSWNLNLFVNRNNVQGLGQ